MFEFVNEIAVLGTSFFMMAVATLWYSEYLFQDKWMKSVGLTQYDLESSSGNLKRNFIITFASYLVAVSLIAVAIGFAQVSGIAVHKVSLATAAGFASLFAGFVAWEQRSLVYYLVTVGFSTTFILGSTFFVYYWPW